MCAGVTCLGRGVSATHAMEQRARSASDTALASDVRMSAKKKSANDTVCGGGRDGEGDTHVRETQ
jgi:hypothetical protein